MLKPLYMTHDLANTNVSSLMIGAGALGQLESVGDDFVVTTMALPWEICRDRLPGTPTEVIIADSMERAIVEAQIERVAESSTVVAIGGGRAIDLGKYLAHRRGIRLVSVPTVLSVDAFVTPAAGLREDGRVVYIGEASPDPLVIDYDVIRTAPPELNIAGIGDLLSIHTAVFDWRLAAEAGKSEYPFSEADCVRASAVLTRILGMAEPILANTDEGLRAIVEGYLEVNRICLPAMHYRVEEGSEHYLFYELEERTGRSFVHGPIIGLGVFVMSRLQNNQPHKIIEFMNQVGLDYHPRSLGIDRPTLESSILNLREYVKSRSDLWYTVIDESQFDEGGMDALLDGLQF